MEISPQVAMVGLGLAGKAIAGRLLSHGYAVAGYDIQAVARSAARDMGVCVADECGAPITGCRTIILSLPNSAVVDSVLWGQGGLGSICPKGTTILDTTTARPKETVAHHARLAADGIRFIDVALSGSSREIAQGGAIALIGDADTNCSYGEYVQAFTRRQFFLGRAGLGHQAKLAVNLVLGLNRLALAEGLTFARKTGFDGELILEILRNSAAYSRTMDTKGDVMLQQDFTPAARLAQHAKDVSLILELAEEVGARVPASRLHAALLQELIDAGWGACDNAAIIKAYETAEGRP